MHYANEQQLSALRELGFLPTEDKTPLTEVAQWLWQNHKIDACYDTDRDGEVSSSVFLYEYGRFLDYKSKPHYTIHDALSWAIDEAIKYLKN
jgi:hypothetical protein